MKSAKVESAILYVQQTVADLLADRIDMSALVITKSIQKKSDEYSGSKVSDKYLQKQAHSVLADKMKRRDESSAPMIGDRISYVVLRKGKDSKVYEKAEDPLYALENNCPIDQEYYVNQQLKLPM